MALTNCWYGGLAQQSRFRVAIGHYMAALVDVGLCVANPRTGPVALQPV